MPQDSLAQSNEGVSWTGYNLCKKVNDQFALSLTQQVRTKNNFSDFGSFLTNAAVHYSPHKQFKISLNYRFSIKNREEHTNRIHTDFTLKQPLGNSNFSLVPRIRYQWQKSNLGKFAHIIRPKLTLKYKPENGIIHPFTATELNYNVKEMNSETSSFKRFRVYGGTNIVLSKKHKLKVFYIYEQPLNVSQPTTNHILAALLTIKL